MRHCYFLLLLMLLPLALRAQQPFERLGVRVPVLSLTNGRYPEFFDNDSLRRIGSVVYNTHLQRIAYLLPADSLVGRAPAAVSSRWMVVDPLAEKFNYESPYVFVNNNPVNKYDPDGRSGIAAIDKKTHTVTVSSTMVFYGPSASSSVATSSARDVQNAWNAAKGTVRIDGKTYSVKFKVTGVYREDLTRKEVESNTNHANNYIKVQDTNEMAKPLKNVSEMDGAGANTGIFLTKHIKKDGSTTEAHEMGHGFGEGHTAGNVQGQGTPSIMSPRGTIVDAQYQYDPSAPAGANGGTMNPETRQVNQTDIDNLGLQKLQFDKNNRANVGSLTNKYHLISF